MENRILRILIIDPSADDAERLTAALRAGPYILKTQLAADAERAAALLGEGTWDIVLLEPATPGVQIKHLVAATRHLPLPTPILVTAGKPQTQNIAQYMADGARDFFLKGDCARLLPAIARELESAAQCQELNSLKERLDRSEARYRAMVDNSQEAVCYCHEGVYVDANSSYLSLLGYASLDELKDVPLLDVVDKADRPRFKTLLQKKGSDAGAPAEFRLVRRDGKPAQVEISVSPVVMAGEPCLQISLNDVSRRKALEEKLEQIHQRDALTGLASKRKFTNELNSCLTQNTATRSACTLVTVEMLRLREHNERLGHATADRMLLQLSQQLKKQLEPGQLMARLGGGQFAVLLRGVAREKSAGICEKFQNIARNYQFVHQGKPLEFEFAYGVEELNASVMDTQKFLSDCFKTAMDRVRQGRKPETVAPAAKAPPAATVAKSTAAQVTATIARAADKPRAPEPKPAVVAAPPAAPAPAIVDDAPVMIPAMEMTPSADTPALDMTPPPAPPAARSAQTWKPRLDRALASDGFQLSFQPIINVHGEMRELFEAMLSLADPNGDLLPARDFIPAAEELGLAAKVDRWVAMRAVETLIAMVNNRQPGMLMVPLTAAAVADNLLLAAMQQHLKTTSVPTERLCIQVQAAALVRDPRAALVFAQIVKRMGAKLAIDDERGEFGEEKLFQSLPWDYYKVPTGNLSGLKAAVAMAHALERPVVATGLEDAELFAALFSESLDYVQGDYLCPQLPEPEYAFAGEQELTSTSVGPSWNVGG